MNQGIRRIQFPLALNLLEGLSPFQWETRFNGKNFKLESLRETQASVELGLFIQFPNSTNCGNQFFEIEKRVYTSVDREFTPAPLTTKFTRY